MEPRYLNDCNEFLASEFEEIEAGLWTTPPASLWRLWEEWLAYRTMSNAVHAQLSELYHLYSALDLPVPWFLTRYRREMGRWGLRRSDFEFTLTLRMRGLLRGYCPSHLIYESTVPEVVRALVFEK